MVIDPEMDEDAPEEGNAGLQVNHDDDQETSAAMKHSTAGAAIDDEEDFSLKFPKEYHSKTLPNQKVVEQYVGHDGKI